LGGSHLWPPPSLNLNCWRQRAEGQGIGGLMRYLVCVLLCVHGRWCLTHACYET
jgi:hypothetical protein